MVLSGAGQVTPNLLMHLGIITGFTSLLWSSVFASQSAPVTAMHLQKTKTCDFVDFSCQALISISFLSFFSLTSIFYQ